MKCIILEYPDGTVAIRGGLSAQVLARFDGDRDEALQWVADELVPVQNPGAVATVEDVTFPADRTFRAAWRRSPGTVTVDMPVARNIHMARIRAARDKRLREEDGRELEAMSKGDDTMLSEVRARKQALREVPQTVDLEAADTPEALAAIWPAELEA